MTKLNYQLTNTILQSTFKENNLHKIYLYHSLYLFRAIVLLRFFIFVLKGNKMFESDGAKIYKPFKSNRGGSNFKLLLSKLLLIA